MERTEAAETPRELLLFVAGVFLPLRVSFLLCLEVFLFQFGKVADHLQLKVVSEAGRLATGRGKTGEVHGFNSF